MGTNELMKTTRNPHGVLVQIQQLKGTVSRYFFLQGFKINQLSFSSWLRHCLPCFTQNFGDIIATVGVLLVLMSAVNKLYRLCCWHSIRLCHNNRPQNTVQTKQARQGTCRPSFHTSFHTESWTRLLRHLQAFILHRKLNKTIKAPVGLHFTPKAE